MPPRPPLVLAPEPGRPPARREARLAWLPWLTLGALLASLALVARMDGITVVLAVDGRENVRRTRSGSVADLIAETSTVVGPGDLVQPPPGARLHDGDSVRIDHARSVRIRADGSSRSIRSHARSLAAVLSEAGVAMAPNDRAKINGRAWPVDRPAVSTESRVASMETRGASSTAGLPAAPWRGSIAAMPDVPARNWESPPGASGSWTIDVLRAVPVTVVESGIAVEIVVAGETVGEALAAAGVPVHPEDVLQPPADTPLAGGMRIDIVRATPFVVAADGATRTARAWADTVGEGLARAGMGLVGRDYAIPAAETPLIAGMQIEVVRVVEDILVQDVPIGYATVTQPDPARELDQTEVLRPGVPGLKRQRTRISYENGQEVSREVDEEKVLSEPVDEIVAYGTNVVWRTIDTPEGPKSYWRQLRVYATSYSASRSGTSQSAPWYGRTRMGLPARRGIIAVDRRLIPLGTWMYVPGYGVALAGDTGGGIRRYHIDLCFDDDAYESWHQYVDAYLLEPLPPEDDMPWILP